MRDRAAAYRRLIALVAFAAIVAVVDGYLYFYHGLPATISRQILRLAVRHPFVPFAAGTLLGLWASGTRLARDWPVIALLAGLLAGHLFWPQTIALR